MRTSCARSSRSRSRWTSPSSSTSSSACRIPPASATIPRPDRSFRCGSAAARAATATACSSTTSRGGRELWGFPKKLADPTLHVEIDQMVGTLDYGPVRVATATMGYKHKAADLDAVRASLAAPNFLLKIIPHVDGSPRICELVEYYLEDITLKGAWTGPAALSLTPHALAPVAELPVLEVVSAVHLICDITLGLGKVAYDYLQPVSSKREPALKPATAGVS